MTTTNDHACGATCKQCGRFWPLTELKLWGPNRTVICMECVGKTPESKKSARMVYLSGLCPAALATELQIIAEHSDHGDLISEVATVLKTRCICSRQNGRH